MCKYKYFFYNLVSLGVLISATQGQSIVKPGLTLPISGVPGIRPPWTLCWGQCVQVVQQLCAKAPANPPFIRIICLCDGYNICKKLNGMRPNKCPIQE